MRPTPSASRSKNFHLSFSWGPFSKSTKKDTHSKSVVFSHPFELKGVDRILPAGDYRVVTDEELIEELSFPVYRRISTMIFLPGQGRQASSLEMVTIDPRDLEAAQDRDRATNQLPAGNANTLAKGPS
jgi:hypothetical protein